MVYRIIHLADVHLDCALGWIANPEMRRAWAWSQRETIKSIAETAKQEGVHAVLIAGDLFEQERFRLDTINFLAAAFEEISPIPVLIVAGNHDPLIPESPYYTRPWPENVHIFTKDRFEPFEAFDGLIVYGVSHLNYGETTNPLATLCLPQSSAVNIILLHGSYAALPASTFYEGKASFPFFQHDLQNSGAVYVALGHYHSLRQVRVGNTLACYPGTPAAVSMVEEGQRYFTMTEVSPEGAKIEAMQTGVKLIERIEVNCTDAKSGDEVMGRVHQTASGLPRNLLLHVVLTGEVGPEAEIDEEVLNIALRGELNLLRVTNRTLPAHEWENLAGEQSVRGEFVRLMRQKISKCQERGDEEQAVRLQKALFYGLDAFIKRRVESR